MKVKVADTILVGAGKDKGKKGKVIRVFRKTNKVTVEKINIKVKHIKKSQSRAGEKITFEGPIDASNVVVICPSCSKPSRIGYKKEEGQKKQRICKKCKETVDVKQATKTTRTKRK
ncbi:50S ribosomal protein L24 [Patescibacteria group bacterium]|nr:50S ribosomal protein L24 [Patescibacteria group bacterium]